jgi:hypothetical protein
MMPCGALVDKLEYGIWTLFLSPKKEGEVVLEMEISNILNASSIRFIDNFQVVERSLQHKLFLNLNPSRQTNFVILVLWTSKDRPFLISSQGAN